VSSFRDGSQVLVQGFDHLLIAEGREGGKEGGVVSKRTEIGRRFKREGGRERGREGGHLPEGLVGGGEGVNVGELRPSDGQHLRRLV